MYRRQGFIGWLIVAMLFTGPLALSGASPDSQQPRAVVAHLEVQPTQVDWIPQVGDYEHLILTVAGPGDFYIQQEFGPGEAPSFSSLDAQGGHLPDGVYAYELRIVPRRGQKLQDKSLVQSGHLWIHEGSFADKVPALPSPSSPNRSAAKPPVRNITPKDIVQPDDVIVQGQSCIGSKCVDGDADEPNVILKLREDYGGQIKFQGLNAFFPFTRIWALQANEQGATGDFFIRDLSAPTIPFRIGAGALDNSLTISPYSSKIGMGTLTPAVQLDVKGDTSGAATARLQNSSSTGYSAIEYLDNAGNVDLFFGIDNAASTTRLNSINGNPIVIMTNSTERIRFPAPGGNVITAANGAFLSAGGTWTNSSSRELKRDIVELSDSDALKTLQGLTPVTYRYTAEPDEQYVGFIAEDVPDLVATNDRKHMNPMDVVAVLTKVVQDQQKTIEELSARLAELEGKEK